MYLAQPEKKGSFAEQNLAEIEELLRQELAAAVPQRDLHSSQGCNWASCLRSFIPSICGFEWGNMFSSINFKYQAVVSQEIPVLLESINLKGGEVSLAEAPFIQNAAEQRQLHAKGCFAIFFFLWLCSSNVCSSASSPVPVWVWIGVLEWRPCVTLYPCLIRAISSSLAAQKLQISQYLNALLEENL